MYQFFEICVKFFIEISYDAPWRAWNVWCGCANEDIYQRIGAQICFELISGRVGCRKGQTLLVGQARCLKHGWGRRGKANIRRGWWGFASCRANQTFHAPQARPHAMGLLASGEEIDADPAAFSFCARSTAGWWVGEGWVPRTRFVLPLRKHYSAN